MKEAGPEEVLVSGAVLPLVAGSAIEFEDRGAREIKGIPGMASVLSQNLTSHAPRAPPRRRAVDRSLREMKLQVRSHILCIMRSPRETEWLYENDRQTLFDRRHSHNVLLLSFIAR